MGIVAAAAIAAVGTVGGAMVSANGAKSAAKAGQAAVITQGQQRSVWKPVDDVNIPDIVRDQGLQNTWATQYANTASAKINASTVDQVMASMGKMYGSPAALAEAQNTISGNIQSELDGKVSQSTQDSLGRSLLTQGMTDLGPGAVSANMAGYLGLTQENLQQQGQSNYQSLYNGYRAALPLTTGAQLLPDFDLSPTNAVNAALNKANSVAGLKLQGMGMGYTSQYNATNMATQASNQLSTNIQSGAGQVAQIVGRYAGNQAGQTATTPQIIDAPGGPGTPGATGQFDTNADGTGAVYSGY